MDMSLISFLGVVVGVVIFVAFSFKGIHLVISAFIAAMVMILTSGLPPIETVKDIWATGFAGFLKLYFLVFILSSIFGKLMSDSGAAKKIAMSLYKLISRSKKNQKFFAALFVPILYSILTFAGISGFVVIYTVLAIGKQIYQKFDVPWRMYCYGGASVIGTFFLAGSLQLCNIAAAEICGTTTSAGLGLSIVAAVVFYAVEMLLIHLDLKKAEKNGEGFEQTGANFAASDTTAKLGEEDENKLPSLILSIVPMVAMILSAAIFHIDILLSLSLGILLCVVLFFKRYTNIMESFTVGITSAFAPTIGVGATSAIASVIKAVPGFTFVLSGLSVLPPLYEGVSLIAIVTFIMASSSASIPSFGADAFARFQAAGLTAETSHRLMTISAFTGIPPHSAGIANATAVAKIEYKRGVIIYLKTGLLGGACALFVSLLLINLGVFV